MRTIHNYVLQSRGVIRVKSPVNYGSVDFTSAGRPVLLLLVYKCEAKTQSPCCLQPGGEQLGYEFRDEVILVVILLRTIFNTKLDMTCHIFITKGPQGTTSQVC